MGSVTDYIECPKCGNEAHSEFYYKTGEEFITCLHCGYSRRVYLEGDTISPENFKMEEFEPHGTYMIKHKGTLNHECGAFTNPNAVDEFLRVYNERKDELTSAVYTTFKDGVLERIVLMEDTQDENNSPDNQVVT